MHYHNVVWSITEHMMQTYNKIKMLFIYILWTNCQQSNVDKNICIECIHLQWMHPIDLIIMDFEKWNSANSKRIKYHLLWTKISKLSPQKIRLEFPFSAKYPMTKSIPKLSKSFYIMFHEVFRWSVWFKFGNLLNKLAPLSSRALKYKNC